MTMLYVAAGAVVLLLSVIGMTVHFARKAEREKIHRWLEESARRTSEEVGEVLGQPLGTDDELLAGIKPDSLPEE